jgi:hypothetical protein
VLDIVDSIPVSSINWTFVLGFVSTRLLRELCATSRLSILLSTIHHNTYSSSPNPSFPLAERGGDLFLIARFT